jgi:hypothetical protein
MAVIMTLCLLVPTASAMDFNDVSDSSNNYEAIDTLYTLGIVEGYSTTTYNPNKTLTRAELCAMLVRAIDNGNIHYNATNVFSDVPISYWARSYIDTAYLTGLMKGYGNGTFGPGDTLTYTQTARTILNALGYGELSWPNGVNTVAYELGLYKDVVVLDLNSGCTRANAAQMIYNAFDCYLVKEYAGQHFATTKNFLNDVLGYTETTETDNHGNIYVAYKDSNKKVYITDIALTYELTIYPTDTNGYYSLYKSGKNSVQIDWNDTTLYADDKEVKTSRSTIFSASKTAVGVFDEKDNLIAISCTTYGTTKIPGENVPSYVSKDKNYNSTYSTVTYWDADKYYISNKYEMEKVKTVKTYEDEYIVYSYTDNRYYITPIDGKVIAEDDWVIIYYDYENEIAGYSIISSAE